MQHLIAGRYQLLQLIGRGAHGEVWEALDKLRTERVAIKRFDPGLGAEPLRIRKEVAILRLLRLPGVVSLFDEGIDQGCAFIVMERIEGMPFPGMPLPQPWASIAPVVTHLLHSLGRIHAAGVVHRDLKPENVLVRPDGRPVVLDFGLSAGGFLGANVDEQGYLMGTPKYLAPEQIRGESITPATDLYAVGVLLYEILAGTPPHKGRSLNQILAARLSGPPVPLGRVAPDIPEPIGLLVDRLLAIEPEDRPRSAFEVLDALRGYTPSSENLPRMADIEQRIGSGEPYSEASLRALIRGHEHFFHIPSDAARLLWARTQGCAGKVAEELEAWIRAGLARWDEMGLQMDRDALERLLEANRAERGEAGRLFDLLSNGHEPSLEESVDIARETRGLAEEKAQRGGLSAAASVLNEGLLAIRRARDAAEHPRLCAEEQMILAAWTEIALLEGTPMALDRVLYEIHRSEARTPKLEALAHLARAGLSLSAGSDRAVDAAEGVPPLENVDLERCRHALRVLSARRISQGRLDAVLADVGAWAKATDNARVRAAFAGWQGRWTYQKGHFKEAAHLHAQAAREAPWAIDRLAALLHCASAWMEAFALDAAAEVAHEAKEFALQCRHAPFEARAVWLLRQVAYRKGQDLCPDISLVEAAAEVGMPDLEALMALTEAAIAWRMGQWELAAQLSGRAGRQWVGMKKQWAAVLARALEAAAQGNASAALVRSLVEEGRRCPVHGVGIQILGLAAVARSGGKTVSKRDAIKLSEMVPREHWGHRMEILSVDEALDKLGLQVDGRMSPRGALKD